MLRKFAYLIVMRPVNVTNNGRERDGLPFHGVLAPPRREAGPGRGVKGGSPPDQVAPPTHPSRCALSQGLRVEVKPYSIRTTVISTGAVATELPESSTERDVRESVRTMYEETAIPAYSFARAVAFAIEQPDDVDVNEILYRPTRQAF
jgi:hypothetical protein